VTAPDLASTLERSGPSRVGLPPGPPGPDELPRQAPLLNAPDARAARYLFELWQGQDKPMRRRQQVWKANRLRRRGVTGVMLVKRQDTDEWIVYAPPGMSKQVPALNKADRLCRLLVATIFADPPEPEATPATDTPQDRDAAEFATRMLTDLGSQNQLDNAGTARRALDLASVYGSAFRYYWVDPKGGGEQPMMLLASPQRVAPIVGPQGQITPDAAITDPLTGQAYPPPYVLRFVRQDGTLTDDRQDPLLRRAWVPKIRCRLLTGHHVRVLPATASDLQTAHGLLVGEWVTLDELRLRFGSRVPTDPETLKHWVAYRPEHPEDTHPAGYKGGLAPENEKRITGESLVFTLCGYYRQTDSYPQGCYIAAVGGDTVLHRQPWVHPRTKEPLDIPIDQFAQIEDEFDFYRRGLMQVLGPANEIRASVLGGMLEHQDRFLNRKVFVPITSTFQPKSAQAMTGTHIPINPGGKPEYEQIPDYPDALEKMFPLISSEMDHESGLEAPATGQNPPGVSSGLHARTIIEQVHIGLSDIQQNTIGGLERGWRIQMQLASAFYTVPQRITWLGDDGSYKERLWTGIDLGSTRDVRLHRGSLSMLAPSAKAAVAQEMFNVVDPQTGEHLLPLHDLRRVILGNVGGQIGLQDDPARQRIGRQIAQWREGPPRGWIPRPDDPYLAGIWAPVLSDDDPVVARMRYFELTRLLNSTDYTRWPMAWRQAVDVEWQRMKQAAGIVTAADQAAAQQQAMQQQQATVEQQAAQQQQQVALQQQAQVQEATRQQQAVAVAGQQFQRATDALLQQAQQGDAALAQQMREFFQAHHRELVQVLSSLSDALKPPPPQAPPPMTVQIPGHQDVGSALAQIQQTMVTLRTSNEAVGEALARVANAMVAIAERPTSFRIVEEGGKPVGITPNGGGP
jgi:hypothetical protein